MSEYKISKRQEDNATREGIIIFPAHKDSKKKIEIYDEDGLYMFSIGDKRYKDYSIYLEEKGKSMLTIVADFIKLGTRKPVIREVVRPTTPIVFFGIER
jgi:hypothetical protein